MNKATLVGRTVADPELRFTNSGSAVSNLRIAVPRRFKREGQPEADFFNVTVWGKPAEAIANHLKKGKLCSVSGEIQNREYEVEGGKRFITEIIADQIEILEWDKKETESETPKAASKAAPKVEKAPEPPILEEAYDDDVPF